MSIQPCRSVHPTQMECHHKPCHTREYQGTIQQRVEHGIYVALSTRVDCILEYLKVKQVVTLDKIVCGASLMVAYNGNQ